MKVDSQYLPTEKSRYGRFWKTYLEKVIHNRASFTRCKFS